MRIIDKTMKNINSENLTINKFLIKNTYVKNDSVFYSTKINKLSLIDFYSQRLCFEGAVIEELRFKPGEKYSFSCGILYLCGTRINCVTGEGKIFAKNVVTSTCTDVPVELLEELALNKARISNFYTKKPVDEELESLRNIF